VLSDLAKVAKLSFRLRTKCRNPVSSVSIALNAQVFPLLISEIQSGYLSKDLDINLRLYLKKSQIKLF